MLVVVKGTSRKQRDPTNNETTADTLNSDDRPDKIIYFGCGALAMDWLDRFGKGQESSMDGQEPKLSVLGLLKGTYSLGMP